jgi:predicted nucleotidyltransferase
MKDIRQIRGFLDDFVAWSSARPDVQGVALVGSYARGAARDDSDIDLVLLTTQPRKYLDDPTWIGRFGTVEKQQLEDYGRLTSLFERGNLLSQHTAMSF